jgi:hypothetical protein
MCWTSWCNACRISFGSQQWSLKLWWWWWWRRRWWYPHTILGLFAELIIIVALFFLSSWPSHHFSLSELCFANHQLMLISRRILDWLTGWLDLWMRTHQAWKFRDALLWMTNSAKPYFCCYQEISMFIGTHQILNRFPTTEVFFFFFFF